MVGIALFEETAKVATRLQWVKQITRKFLIESACHSRKNKLIAKEVPYMIFQLELSKKL